MASPGYSHPDVTNHQQSFKPKAVIMADDVPWISGSVVDAIYGESRLGLIRAECDLDRERITSANIEKKLASLSEVEVIFSCWGMLPLTSAQLEKLPKLKAVFYASGSVAGFAKPFLQRGILISSGVAANAIPVAEFSLAQILLSCKGVWRNSLVCRQGPWKQADMPIGPGVYGETVALLGIGSISRHLLKLLAPFNLKVIAVSNYLSEAEAKEMGIDRLVDIDTCFREAIVVSNHLADKPANRAILNKAHFASMREGATFINTGRGAQVDECALIEVLQERQDLTALLDVQEPEPPTPESELYTLSNVHMTSHIGGSMNDELARMADFVLEDFLAWKSGGTLQNQVDPAAFKQRA